MSWTQNLKNRLTPELRQTCTGILNTMSPAHAKSLSTGGTDSPEYCYEVFIKHLTLCSEAGMMGIPKSVAEIGPGDSLGIGLAALIVGAEEYHALDVVTYSNPERNLRTLERLITFFRERRPNPSRGWPGFDHLLDGAYFPSAILSETHLERCLEPSRLQAIRHAVLGKESSITLQYHSPWTDAENIGTASLDWIFSQSVMEHVDDLPHTYECMRQWLCPGGFMSHQIDFRCHRLFPDWNGHWAIGSLQWKLIRGRRPYFINRLPYTAHEQEIRKHFEVRRMMLRDSEESGIPDSRFRAPFHHLNEQERKTAGCFLIAAKPSK